MSAKREQFLKVVGQSWSVAAAAHELGVSRSSADYRRNSYRATRTDGTVVVLAALTLAPKPVPARFFSQAKRSWTADDLRTGRSLRALAALLGRSPSTISRALPAVLPGRRSRQLVHETI